MFNPSSRPPSSFMPPETPSSQPLPRVLRILGIIVAVIVLVFLVWSLVITKEKRAVTRITVQAQTLLDEGKFAEAQTVLQEQIVNYPDALPLYLSLANAYLAEGFLVKTKDRSEASKKARETLLIARDKGGRNDARYHDLFALSHSIVGNYEEALKQYQKSLAIDPNNPYALLGAGNTLEMTGELSYAYKFYQKAEEVLQSSPKPNDLLAGTYVNLGKMAMIMDNDAAKAMERFNAALGASKNKTLRAEIHYAMSTLEYQKGVENVESSRTHAEAAIAEAPESDWGYLGVLRAMILSPKEGDEKKAGEYIWKALQLNPSRALTRMLQGQIAHRAGNTAQAIASYKAALRIIYTPHTDPTLSRGASWALASDTHAYLALAYHAEGKKAEAMEAITLALKTNPLKIAYLIENSKPFAPFKSASKLK